MTVDERKLVAQAFVRASAGRVPVFVQVGHNSLNDARELATHAQSIGASAVSATCPSYFRVSSVATLVDCMSFIAAAAPEVPFYYYHIPSLTGANLDMVDFLELGSKSIPNLAGIKFTATEVHEYQRCVEFDGRRFEIMWGCDEMLLSALTVGARAAIGSTYNIASPLYARLISSFRRGDWQTAAELQMQAVSMIKMISVYPFHSAMKEILHRIGFDLGPCRLPVVALTDVERAELRRRIDAMPFFG